MRLRFRISNILRLALLFGAGATLTGCGLTARDSFFFSRPAGLKPISEAQPEPIWLVNKY